MGRGLASARPALVPPAVTPGFEIEAVAPLPYGLAG
jgi:hypothetical protein